MKFFSISKDGGPESNVTGFFLIEIKKLFSVALLHFADGSREAYHSHAFNSISWVMKGSLVERHLNGLVDVHKRGFTPIKTFRNTFHRVLSEGDTWVFTLRGPWVDRWQEYLPKSKERVTLTHGRIRLETK